VLAEPLPFSFGLLRTSFAWVSALASALPNALSVQGRSSFGQQRTYHVLCPGYCSASTLYRAVHLPRVAALQFLLRLPQAFSLCPSILPKSEAWIVQLALRPEQGYEDVGSGRFSNSSPNAP
jgi:hypothetical protein